MAEIKYGEIYTDKHTVQVGRCRKEGPAVIYFPGRGEISYLGVEHKLRPATSKEKLQYLLDVDWHG
jgi:hypothetical protein